MHYAQIMDALRSYVVPGGVPSNIFLLPEPGMRAIYDCITANKLTSALELGTGFCNHLLRDGSGGQEIGGTVTSVDIHTTPPAIGPSLAVHAGIGPELKFVVDPLGYNWWMADLIKKQTHDGVCTPFVDFCFLDGATSGCPMPWPSTSPSSCSNPVESSCWMTSTSTSGPVANWQVSHPHLSDRELDAYQIGMVWDLVVKQHPEPGGFRITEDGRMGWSRSVERRSRKPPSGKGFSLGCSLGSESSITRRCRRLTAIAVMRGFRKAAGGFRYVRTASSRSCRRPVVPR